MTAIREIRRFEADQSPLISNLVVPAFLASFAFLAVFFSQEMNLHSALSALAVATAVLFVTYLAYLALGAFQVYAIELTAEKTLVCLSMVKTTVLPINQIARLVVGNPNEMTSPYIGIIETPENRLVTCELGEFAFSRLGFFFRYISTLNPQIALNEKIDFLAPRNVE